MVSCDADVVSYCLVGHRSCCILLSEIADGYVDLPGRGYSSTPTPSVHPQTSEFFIATILFVLASSRISWTGPKRFSILGYSLGGGIAVSFASCFPDRVSSVILLAPSGLIRPYHFSWHSRLLYSSRLLPDWVTEPLVYWKLSNSSRPDQERSDSAFEDDFSLTEQGGDEIVSRSRFDVPMALVCSFSYFIHGTCCATERRRNSSRRRSIALLLSLI